MNWLFVILIHLNYCTDILILACLTQVVDFNIHVTESGEEYNETIEVDTQKQTEVFKVPAHPGVDRSDVMHDFKQVIISSTTLLDVTCCVSLHTLLHVVARCYRKFETGETFSATLARAAGNRGEENLVTMHPRNFCSDKTHLRPSLHVIWSGRERLDFISCANGT